ncbi:hypothetical protein FOS14_05650 [Skermania sp. ID1734]|nr:hypothetical protein FOS14_05650 [Skermania sp. ID1734]
MRKKPTEDAAGAKSGAARRAYERRQQRATLVLGPGATPGTLPRRANSLAAKIPYVATILGLLGAGLVVTLLLTTRSAEDSYQLTDARDTNQHLSQVKAGLERDVAAADSAPDLAARARQLGMIPAVDPARLVVAPDGSVQVVGKPAPAQGAPAPLLNASNPSLSLSEAPTYVTPQPQPTVTRATPQVTNGAQVNASGEQLVPMSIPAGTGGHGQ